jgi:amino acid transporter
VTTDTRHDDAELDRYGYRQQFVRSLRHFESFAVAFSFISITTGIFTTYGFALAAGGPRSIWTWVIVVAGQSLVALVYGALATRVPLSGYSYQWASRLANAGVGWWLGWMSFAFLSIVTVSVDYGLVQVAFQPLIGEAFSPTSAALETLAVLAIQAALIIVSTRLTTRVNNTAVATEVIGIVGLTILLVVVAAVRSKGHWGNVVSTGVVPHAGYYNWLGPFMLATLLGAYTIVGFESASNLAEETFEPHKTIPKAMIRAVLVSGVVGFAFLIALTYATSSVKAASANSAPVAFIVQDVLGGVMQKIFLIVVCVSIFACGMVIMVTNSRLIFAMARDKRLPGHQLLSRVPNATGGPSWATILAAVIGAIITLVLRTHIAALATLFTASTIMPALLYTATVVLYVLAGRRRHERGDHFSLGRWEIPVIAGALIWLVYELIILIAPSAFRDAQYYVLGSLGLGLIVYAVQWVLEPRAMRTEPGAHGAEALMAERD